MGETVRVALAVIGMPLHVERMDLGVRLEQLRDLAEERLVHRARGPPGRRRIRAKDRLTGLVRPHPRAKPGSAEDERIGMRARSGIVTESHPW